MMITKKELFEVRKIKAACKRDYFRASKKLVYKDLKEGYRSWQTWRLCEMIERVAK